jgi:hypothetical protein
MRKVIERLDKRMFDLLLLGDERYNVRVGDKTKFAIERRALARQVFALRSARRALTTVPFLTPRRVLSNFLAKQ